MCFLSCAEASKRPPQPMKMQRRYSDVAFELAASGRSDVPVNKAQLRAESGARHRLSVANECSRLVVQHGLQCKQKQLARTAQR